MKANRVISIISVVCLMLVSSSYLAAQQPTDSGYDDYASRTRAIDQSESRAEKEAEQLVSLSPERIILLLQQEPGLLLEVKKMLVRDAYAQGRVLDPKDLTDEAVFRLIEDDEQTRALITQQIVDRGYVGAKPTREEIAKEMADQSRAESFAEQQQSTRYEAGNSGTSRPASPNFPVTGTQQQNTSPPFTGTPQQNAPPSAPENQMNSDQRRALLQASLQGSENSGDSNGLPLDSVLGSQQQLSPEQIQQLVSAYRNGQLPPGAASAGNLGKLASTANAPSGLTQQDVKSQEQAYAESKLPPSTLPQAAKLESNAPYTPTTLPYREPAPEQPIVFHRSNPYADVPSLYDLYSQYSRRPGPVQRFGMDIFQNGTGNFDQLPMDLPVGPDYVVGPGDGLNIDLWGSVSQRLVRTVDRQGRLSLPEIGTIQAAGHTLADVQHMVQTALRTQFRELQADVSLNRLRAIRVYVVGDVLRPGAYDVSSLSTPLNALYQAGGPTSRGSMRIVKHYRGTQLVETVDLYDLLLHGVQAGMQRLESGDTILVPPIGQQVTLEGMVRRPAIYELAGETNLSQVLELAGGVLPSGTLRHIDVERVQSHQDRTMLRVDLPVGNNDATLTTALDDFHVQDGDVVRISPILPFSEKTVYLAGHVFRPGKYAYKPGMKITDLIRGYADLLPEPYKQHAEVVRLTGPELKPEIISFNLGDALQGKGQDLVLKPFDTVRIFGRFDFEDPPIVTVTGEVRDPGDHLTNGATRLRDAILLAGNTTPDAELDDVQIFRKTHDGKLRILSSNLQKAIAGDPHDNILLLPEDRVFVHRNTKRIDPATVQVEGDVARPGTYPLGTDMTATELIHVAGGLKRSAYVELAELTRYDIRQGKDVEAEHIPVRIGAALQGEPDTDMRLHSGDVLTIKQIAGWKDIGATVTLGGEVLHPGTYGIQEGERLSDVIARAGGFRADAYPYGAIFERVEIRQLEEKNRDQLIAQTKQEGAGLASSLDDPLGKEATLVQWRNTLQKLQAVPPAGRMVIHIGQSKSWVHTPADIQLRAGDEVYIPKKPNFVMVQGSVFNQTAVAFRPGKSARWYLRQAGGATATADKKRIFVVRADGTVAGGTKTLFSGGALEAPMLPGDMIVVPDKALGGGFKWRETLQVAQLVSAVGIAVQVARGF